MSLPVQNKMPKIIMPICDDNLYTLKMSSFLFDKYWPPETKIDVVGFKRPEFDISENEFCIYCSEADWRSRCLV